MSILDDSVAVLPKQPTLQVRDFFKKFRGARIYHPPLVNDQGVLVGNHGDRLMVLGTQRLYQDFNIDLVDDGNRADLIVIGGSGGMLEKMQWITGIFRNCCRQFPTTPICVLPSTFFYPTRPFGDEIGEREGEVTLFCREAYSYRHLREHKLPKNIALELDEDMAFELRGSDLAKGLSNRPAKHVLLVERTDVEHPSIGMDSRKLGMRRKISKALPRPVKQLIYPLVTAMRARKKTPFRSMCDDFLKRDMPELVNYPQIATDVSNINTGSFEDFCNSIAEAGAVFTTRLHVGILASILGKRTYIFGGPYHKIKGIYEFSLAGLPNVTYVDSDALA